jgi:hypothetical protein
MPQSADGWRILHQVSVHNAAMQKSADTATVDHQLDHQGTKFSQ